MKHSYAFALLAMLAAGCAPMKEALTPSTEVVKDEFDGSLLVRQPPAGAASGVREPWHTLGFEWSQKTPDTVYLMVGANGAGNISAVAFNADGRVIDNAKPVSAFADYSQVPTRRFSMPWSSFLALAEAGSVKMKIVRLDEYTVSSFGAKHESAAVNPRIASFVAKVREVRAGKKTESPVAKTESNGKAVAPAKAVKASQRGVTRK